IAPSCVRTAHPHTPPLFPYTTLFRSAALRTHARRVRRRRLEDHWEAPAESRLPGIRHRPRQALRASRSARVEGYRDAARAGPRRSEEHTSELQSPDQLVCRLMLETKN